MKRQVVIALILSLVTAACVNRVLAGIAETPVKDTTARGTLSTIHSDLTDGSLRGTTKIDPTGNSVHEAGAGLGWSYYRNYSSSSVGTTDTAIQTTTVATSRCLIADTGGYSMRVTPSPKPSAWTGDYLQVPPGGGDFPVSIPSSSTVYLRVEPSASTATIGELNVNCVK